MKRLIKVMTLLISVSLFATDNQPWYTRLFNRATTWYTGARQSAPVQKQPVSTGGLSTYFSWIWPKNRGKQVNPVYKQKAHLSLTELKKEYAKQQAIIRANIPTSNETAITAGEKYKKIRDARDKLDTEIIPAIEVLESPQNRLMQWRNRLDLDKERLGLIQEYQKLHSQITNLDTLESGLKKEGKKFSPSGQKKYAQQKEQLSSNMKLIRKRLDQIARDLGENSPN